MAKTSPPTGRILWLKDIDLLSAHPEVKKDIDGRLWDPVRQAWLTAQPEEWVRLCLTHYLSIIMGFSVRRMSVERATASKSSGRFDLTLHDQKGAPFLLCECKSPSTVYHLDHWIQLMQYNKELKARYAMWTNGPQVWLWDNEKAQFVENLEECVHQYL